MNIITAFTIWIAISGCTLSIISAFDDFRNEERQGYVPKPQESYNKDINGGCSSTPLHLAMGLVKQLISEGADLLAKDNEGMTPYDLALSSKIQEIIDLTKYDTNKKEMFTHHTTPLHHAIRTVTNLVHHGSSTQAVDCQNLTPLDIINSTSSRVVLSVPYNEDKTETIDSIICNRTDLHLAVLNKNMKSIHQLLLKKENMYAIDCDENTPMDLAISENDHEIILAFIKAQYDVNRKLKGKMQSLLLRALFAGNLQTTKLVLELGTNKSVLKKEGSNLLLEALSSDKSDIVQFLIDNGAKLDYSRETGDTYVHKYSEEGNAEALLRLKMSNILDAELVNTANKRSETALLKAVKGNFPAVVNILLASGAKATDLVEGGKTYLHVAIENKSRDALLALLENDMPVDAKNSSGISPILFAVRIDDTDSMDILKEFGSDLKQSIGTNSNTLLHEAALRGSVKALAWLLDNGASVEEKNDEEFTALHHAARYGKVLIVEELISRKANVNAVTKYKDSPLHWASVNGNLEIVQDIILKGGDVNARQQSAWTPLHLAAWYGHLPVVKELLANGANLDALNNPHHTPLYYAIQEKHNEVADYLKSHGGSKV